ncbi:hypothetical protein J8273_7472 [Carpediemonas membranifera]|uniref:Transmembrane protein n=1 Tax=Carpediemonas membranifera TaxID=201153 RepID=A0A8J6AQL7_9EUKA|nr:hypothetical protein J8273_7472 [Carpediemonas membranifera]|eukprot:KAG9391198.1 hypothetical protein J8273_7472 [Carpediemonas membranifera]
MILQGTELPLPSELQVCRRLRRSHPVFELSYLSVPKNMILRQIVTVCLLMVAVHALSLCCDETIYVWPGALHTIQRALMWSRMGPLPDVLSTTAMNVVSGITLLVVFAMLGIHVIAVRQMTTSSQTLPNRWLIRAMTASFMARTSVMFLPVLVIMDNQVATRLSLDAADLVISGLFAVGSAVFTVQTAFVLFMSHQFAFTTHHPLGRQHARVEPTAYVLLSVGMGMISVSNDVLAPTIKGIVVFLACAFLVFLVSVFTPYYRILPMILVNAILWALGSAATCAVTPWLALCLLSLTPVVALLPMGTVKLTTLATRKYRAEVMALESPDQVPETRPFLLFPCQVEVALRESRKKIAKAKKDIAAVNKRVPMAIFEFSGAVDEAGVLDPTRLSDDDLAVIAQARQTIEAETAYGMRLFSITRSRWPHSAYLALTYIIYTAAYRTQSLQSVMHSTASTVSRSFSIDFQYARFLCKNYTDSLHSDANVLTKLEAQRNQHTLMKSQRSLADEMANLWRRMYTTGGRSSTSNFKYNIKTVSRISALRVQIDALYGKALRHPSSRVVRSYAQYLSIIDPSPAVAAYCEELYGVADELEVAPGEGEKGRIRVGLVGARGHGSSRDNARQHVPGIIAIAVIAAIIHLSVLSVVGFTYIHTNLLWQTIGLMHTTAGAQRIAAAFAVLRAGDPSFIVSTSSFAGAPWKAAINEMSDRYHRHSLDNFSTAMYALGGAPYTDYADVEPYEVLELSESWVDGVIDKLTISATHLAVNIPQLLRDKIITVPVFEGQVETGTGDVSLMAYYSSIVHAAEAIAACVVDELDSGSTTAAQDCTAGQVDTIMGYEKALLQPVMMGILEVDSNPFVLTQVFPVLELSMLIVILLVADSCAVLAAIALYVLPVLKQNAFSMRAIHLLNSLPEATLQTMIDQIDEFKRSIRSRDQPMTRAESDHESDATPIAHTRTQSRGSMKFILPEADAQDSTACLLDSVPRTISQAIINENFVSSTDLAPRALVGSVCSGRTESSSSDDGESGVTPGDGRDFTEVSRVDRATTQAKALARMLVGDMAWAGIFGFMFLTMIGVVVYRTGVVTTTAMTVFYQYVALNNFQGASTTIMSHALTSAWAPTPVTQAYTLDLCTKLSSMEEGLVSHLSGHSAADEATVTDTWALVDPKLARSSQWANTLLGSGDSWVEGGSEDDIAELLHNEECLRFFDDMCEAPFTMYTSSGSGLINAVSAADTFIASLLSDLQSGTPIIADLLTLAGIVNLDITSGFIKSRDLLIARLDAQLAATRSNVGYFLGGFILMLAVYYYTHLYRPMVMNGRTRRQLGDMFRSVPRAGIPAGILGKLVEAFPEE